MKLSVIKSWRLCRYDGLDAAVSSLAGLEYAVTILLLVAFVEMLISGRFAWVRAVGFFGFPVCFCWAYWRAMRRAERKQK